MPFTASTSRQAVKIARKVFAVRPNLSWNFAIAKAISGACGAESKRQLSPSHNLHILCTVSRQRARVNEGPHAPMSPLRPLSRSPRPLLLPLLLALAACSAGRTDAPAMPEVGVIIASAQPLALQQTLPGRAVPFEISEVRPQVGGLIRQRLFTEGQQVKAGQLLYQVDPAPYQAAFDTARGQLAQAEATVLSAQPKAERTRALVSMDAASKQDADDATSALKQAQANVIAARAALQAARINLDYTRVTAPIDGRIGTSSVTAGALVAAGQDTALTTIQRLDPVYLDVTQSSTQMLALRKQLDAGLVKDIDGKAQVRCCWRTAAPTRMKARWSSSAAQWIRAPAT